MSVQSSRTSRPAHSNRSSWVHSGIQIASVQMALCIYTRVMMCGVRGPNFQKCRFRSTNMCDSMSPEASCVVRIKSLTLVFWSPPTRWMSGFSILTRHALSGHAYKAVTLNAFPPLVLIWIPALIHVYMPIISNSGCLLLYVSSQGVWMSHEWIALPSGCLQALLFASGRTSGWGYRCCSGASCHTRCHTSLPL